MNRNSNYFFYVYLPIINWDSLIENLIKNIISFNNINGKCV